MLEELKMDLTFVSDLIRQQLLSVLSRGLNTVAFDDDDVGHTTLSDHRIEAGNSRQFRDAARPGPYAHRIFIERELKRLLRLGIICEANTGECP